MDFIGNSPREVLYGCACQHQPPFPALWKSRRKIYLRLVARKPSNRELISNISRLAG
ncbi:hypothetical protein DK45_3822 [Bordetella bronchiseptica]|nr:hypothetical protein DK45_3822 [Bordetella bronchiseptica]